ncbi:MAG: hypothetical protein ACR2OA_08090 [Rubripirellula sp.]
MRSNVFLLMVFVAVSTSGASRAAAQAGAAPAVIVLDRPSADLLQLHFPNVRCDVVVSDHDAPYEELNRRAWLMRDATVVLYRGDQGSMASRIFRERLTSQGVRVFDLAEHFCFPGRFPRARIDPDSRRLVRNSLRGSVLVRAVKSQDSAVQNYSVFLNQTLLVE